MSQADELKTIERERLRALVAGDIEVAQRLHADDFQLVTPLGMTLNKQDYLGAIAAGRLKYFSWEPDEIFVRVGADSAVLRYRAKLANVSPEGKDLPEARLFWHTDFYERRSGRWQVVWSQATAVVDPRHWADITTFWQRA